MPDDMAYLEAYAITLIFDNIRRYGKRNPNLRWSETQAKA